MPHTLLNVLAGYLALSKSAKMAVAAALALTIEGLLQMLAQAFETYIFADWQGLGFIAVLVVIDTSLGFYRAWREKRISSRGFSKLGSKLATYGILLVIAHVFAEFTVKGQPVQLLEWFGQAVYPFMLVREGLSLIEHLTLLGWVKVPAELRARLEHFTEDGEPKANA